MDSVITFPKDSNTYAFKTLFFRYRLAFTEKQ